MKDIGLKVLNIPIDQFTMNLQKWQLDVLSDFDSGLWRFFLINVHRRARKTTLGINLIIREAWKHPKSVYLYVAPTYTQAKSIFWTDPNMFFNYLPECIVSKRIEDELLIKLSNGSVIQVKGASDPDKIRGIDCRGVILDEFAVMDIDIWQSILRPILAQDISRWAIFLFTPSGRNHAYDYWINSENLDGWKRYKYDVYDTKMISEKELENVKKESPYSKFRSEFLCDFVADDEMTLITYESIEKLKNHIYNFDSIKSSRKVIACDPSEGGDECVLYAIDGTGKIFDEMIIKGEKDLNRVLGLAFQFSGRVKCDDFVVDAIGVGSGICMGLTNGGKRVVRINSAERANESEIFSNRRAEMWWYVAKQIRDFEVCFFKDCKVLINQLTSVRYKMSKSGKVLIEDKASIKKLIKSSPDRADTYIYGIWGLQFMKSKIIYLTDDYARNNNRMENLKYGYAGGW